MVILQCGAAGGNNSAGALRAHSVWLGGLFNPEAFITATRQCVAQANSWSLEELALDIFIQGDGDEDEGGPMSMDDASFGIEKLKLQVSDTKTENSLSIASCRINLLLFLHIFVT